MALAEFYPMIKAGHMGLAFLSGAVFAVRGVGVLAGSVGPLAPWVRRSSQLIDTALLVAALLLLGILRLNPFATPWLLVKLLWLVAYIALGTLALRGAATRPRRLPAFAAALLCYLMIVVTARTHDPLGFLRLLGI